MADRIIDRGALDTSDGMLHCAEIAVDMLGEAALFSYLDPDEAERAQGRICVLVESIRTYVKDARAILVREVGGDQCDGEAAVVVKGRLAPA